MHLPLRTYGSAGLARMRWMALAERLGEDHPAAQAALGRLCARSERAHPQRDGVRSPAVVGWARERSVPGFNNRAERRARARNAGARQRVE